MAGRIFNGISIAEMGADQPWPPDAKLYQPLEMEQILLPDSSSCLAVKTYLRMCGLEFEVVARSNCEFMSPTGRVPFIRCGNFIVAELDPIIQFIHNKGISLSANLDTAQRANMRAYMSLVTGILGFAETYICWCDMTTLNEVTWPRNGSVYPWPLNHYVNWRKKRQVLDKLRAINWLNKTLDEVYEEAENCCCALSERLDSGSFFFGNRPTELDALVFGHLFSILTTPLPCNKLAAIVHGYTNLIRFCKNIERLYFIRSNQ